MKKQKWLLILIAAVVLLNIAVFIALHLTQVDALVKHKITRLLADKLDMDVQIGSFDFNDKQVNVSNITLRTADGKVSGIIRQIYIEYDLFSFLLHRFRDFSSISNINIYDPDFQLRIPIKQSDGKSPSFVMPDLKTYFKRVKLHNGTLDAIVLADAGTLHLALQNVQLDLRNGQVLRIDLSAMQDSNATLQVSAAFDKGALQQASISVNQLHPEVKIAALDHLDFVLDAAASYRPDSLAYRFSIQDVAVDVAKQEIRADSLIISGNDALASLAAVQPQVNGAAVMVAADVLHPFSSPWLQGSVQVPQMEIKTYVPLLDAKVATVAHFDCPLNDIRAEFSLQSNRLKVAKQQISTVRIAGIASPKRLDVTSIRGLWEDNDIRASGYYIYGKDMHASIKPMNINYTTGGLRLKGTVAAEISYKNDVAVNAEFSNGMVKIGPVEVHDLTGSVAFEKQKYHLRLKQKTNLDAKFHGNLKTNEHTADISFSRFRLDTANSSLSLPMASGTLQATYSPATVLVDGNIHIYDQRYGKYDGIMTTRLVANRDQNHSKLSVAFENGKFNYTPIRMHLLAEGTMDSLQTTFCTINDQVMIDGWMRLTPQFDYGVALRTRRLHIRDILRYFAPSYVAENTTGLLDLDLNYNFNKDNRVAGNIALSDVTNGTTVPLTASMKIAGTRDSLDVTTLDVSTKTQHLLSAVGSVVLSPQFAVAARGVVRDVQLEGILPEVPLSGQLNGRMEIDTAHGKLLDASADAKNLSYAGIVVTSADCSFHQRDSLLTVDFVRAKLANGLTFSGDGALGYNMFSSQVFADSSRVQLSLDGNYLGILAQISTEVLSAYSAGTCSLTIGTNDEGLCVPKGDLKISKGRVVLKSQQEALEKIRFHGVINNNVLDIQRLRAQLGPGSVNIRNQVLDDENDFIFGPLKIGHLYIKTIDGGVLLHMPGYIPDNGVVSVIIQGRDSEEMEVSGPFDDLQILGDVVISNGNAIYPPGTENLLKIFTRSRPEKRSEESAGLPFTLDMMLHFNDNVRYVTYPVDILVKPGSYLNLSYKDGQWSVPDALFTSDSGSANMFGTDLTLDFAEISISKHLAESGQGIKINGTFYKDTPDGTRVLMDVFTDRDRKGYSLGNLRFTLRSDKGDQSNITDILYLLRYGRRPTEISDSERNALFRDDMVQMAGLGINSVILDPLISPVENNLRRWLRLDVVQLRTEVIQNIFATYYTGETSQEGFVMESNRASTTKFSADTFLNNLSIRMGKFISRKLFFDYEVKFQKPADINLEPDIGIYHDASLRYMLPWKLSLIYSIEIDPEKDELIHEVSLERSFRFW